MKKYKIAKKKEEQMNCTRYKTMRHIETVRNYLNGIVIDLLKRAEKHDQTKLKEPEAEIFDIYTAKLRNSTYGSDEYKKYLKEMQVALDHHYANNRHHPEYFKNGIKEMNLIDILEMLCDWKAATMRHNDGDIYKSIELNQKRFNYNDEIKQLLINTMKYIDKNMTIFHNAKES